ncbi:MAG: RsmE family RNA methyltransferase [bacterium]
MISEQVHDIAPEKKHMIIALPNKRDKVELIVQKLTECGLDQIIFWPSERSIIREWNPKKEERLQKIIKEAVEQSRGRTMPELIFTPDIQKYLQDTELIVFDTAPTSDAATPGKQGTIPKSHITGLVGPE